jgi:uncharacterized protein (TIGR03118 family)
MTVFQRRKSRRTQTRKALQVEPLEARLAMTAFIAHDLVSDQPGVAPITDPTLVNAWGISLSPNGGGFWISANGKGLSEVYGGDVNGSPITQPFKVNIPTGKPTGQVFNSTSDFLVSDGTNTKAATFLFASESGSVSGWNGAVGVVDGSTPPSVTAETAFQASDGAIYKGMALANNGSGNFLYLTDFHNGKIDVLDSQFHLTQLSGSFTDPNLPKGFAPFGIAAINGRIYVSYAKQDAGAEDDVPGQGHGFINVFDANGHFQQRLVSRGDLNSPWAMVQAPAGFGPFGNALLVGNFGDGRIHAFDLNSGAERGTLSRSAGHPLQIDGLWGLAFGNGKTAGDATALYYSAGPDDESHGLFGRITANPDGTNPVTAVLSGDDLTITGSRDNDRVTVGLSHHDTQLVITAGGQKIGEFPVESVGTIHFNGLAGDDVFVVGQRVTIPVIADGGAGDDVLVGSDGNNLLLGGSGNDILGSGNSRDVLIGGEGRDRLHGHGGDDLLIGASTDYDTDEQALQQIVNEWTSNQSYLTRVATLRTGTNGVPQLDGSTVHDDDAIDHFFGGADTDWFFGQLPDLLHDRRSNERIM